jgi:hypothetical protein
MYEPLVILHSWLRWLVLLTALFAVVRAVRGKAARAPWTPGDDAAGKWFVGTLDAQLLVGLALYLFFSPYTMAAWRNMGEAMRDSLLRFMAVEHLFGMIIAIALAHIGRVRIRKATDPVRRHTLAMVFFGLALVIMLASIPWPFSSAARPLFRI